MINPTERGPGPEIPAPLDEPANQVIPYANALVLERGIQLERIGRDAWQYLAKGTKSTASLCDITTALGLKVVKVTVKGASRDHHFLLPTTLERLVFRIQVRNLGESIGRIDPAFAHHVPRLTYIAAAAEYHCAQLVDRYVDVLDFITLGGQRLLQMSEDFNLHAPTGAPVYFEFEALVTALIRGYDAARYPLWSAYGAGGSTPKNFRRVVERLSVPKSLEAVLEKAISRYDEIKKYRDCIQHYVDLGSRQSAGRIQLRQGLAWSVFAVLPDNPEARSSEKFRYTDQVDALSYGWSLTDMLLRDLTTVIDALPVKSSGRC